MMITVPDERDATTRLLATVLSNPDQRGYSRVGRVLQGCETFTALMICELPDCPELAEGLRQLAGARDEFIRAAFRRQPPVFTRP